MPDICHALTIAAPPEAVFDAVNSAEGNRAFWTDQTEYEPSEGSVAVFSFGPEWQPTSIAWALTPVDGGTHVRFEHRDWASADGELAACTYTWGRILFELDEFVRTGRATPPFKVY
jgi:uncharacterized protein YndB with AHSA1/START domain